MDTHGQQLAESYLAMLNKPRSRSGGTGSWPRATSTTTPSSPDGREAQPPVLEPAFLRRTARSEARPWRDLVISGGPALVGRFRLPRDPHRGIHGPSPPAANPVEMRSIDNLGASRTPCSWSIGTKLKPAAAVSSRWAHCRQLGAGSEGQA